MPENNCPNGWPSCEDCQYYQQSLFGPCPIEPDIQEAAATAEKTVDQEAAKSVKEIKKQNSSDPSRLIRSNSANFWRWWAGSSPPDAFVQRDPINALAGAIVLGGGSKNMRKKSKKGNKPTQYVWGEIP